MRSPKEAGSRNGGASWHGYEVSDLEVQKKYINSIQMVIVLDLVYSTKP